MEYSRYALVYKAFLLSDTITLTFNLQPGKTVSVFLLAWEEYQVWRF
jgi:hypothetical protein